MIGRSNGLMLGSRSERRRPRGVAPRLESLEGRALLAGGTPVFGPGDVLIGVTGGVQWRHADGSLVATLPVEPGQYTTGMAFDGAGNLFATGFLTDRIDRIAPDGAGLGPFGSGFNKNPESIVFDAAGNAYVGQSDGNHRVLKFDAAGTLVDSYPVAIESRGSDWIELAADQRTLYYTSEGHTIKRYDLVARKQLPDFATGLPGDESFQLQLLPDGGVLLADDHWIFRFGADGKIAQTYGYSPASQWFNLVLDPDGTSFWTSDQGNGEVARFDIATGRELRRFVSDPGGAFGLAVVGGPRAATAASLAVSTVYATASATVGEPVTYTIQVANLGPGTAAHSQVVFTLPAGATAVSGSMPQGGSPLVQDGRATFDLGDLPGGAATSVTLVFHPDAPGTLTSQATAATTSPTMVRGSSRVTLTTGVSKVADPPPVVTGVALQPPRHGGCCQTNAVVIHLSQPMSTATVLDPRNYTLRGPFAPGSVRRGRRRALAIRRVDYDPATETVTLTTRQGLGIRWIYQLTINAGGSGLKGDSGVALAGSAGQPGTNYTGDVRLAASNSARAASRPSAG